MENDYLNLLTYFGVGGAHPGGLQLTKEIIDQLALDKPIKILDIGCGTGQTTCYLNSLHHDVIGIDKDSRMIIKAKERNNRLKQSTAFQVADAECLPFQAQMFDLVLCESVLSFTNVTSSLKEIKRVLKATGSLIAIEMTNVGLEEYEENQIKAFYNFQNILEKNQWISLFEQYNFSNIKSFQIDDFMLDSSEPSTDFMVSSYIPDKYFNLLAEHEQFNKVYQEKIVGNIYICQK
jgi:ubiquinone/menaquinone biosynthesis C-methylase UbiE